MPHLQLPTANLYYDIHQATGAEPSNPPLVLLAGLASDSLSWRAMIHSLSQQRQVITLDNRGSGRTESDTDITLLQMAKDCLALCDHLNLERVDLLGHSMGGLIALQAAHLAPDRINRLVLCNSSVKQCPRNLMMLQDWADDLDRWGPTAKWYRTFFYWILTPGFFKEPQTVNDLVELALSYEHGPTAKGFRAQVDAMATVDASPWLKTIEAPTLVVTASSDLLLPPGSDAAGLAALPHSTVKCIDGVGHSMPTEAPKLLSNLVLEFLDDRRL